VSAIIRTRVEGLLTLRRQMQVLAMPINLRRRLLYRTAKAVIRDSKHRVKKQIDLNGQPYEKRARKRKSNRKMLSRLVKSLKVTSNNHQVAELGFYSQKTATIASEQQRGATKTVRASDLSSNQSSRHAPATRRQAKALRDAGYTIKGANGKRKKAPSLKWITANMKTGQAGSALRYLKGKAEGDAPKSWVTTLPARSFLGATGAEITQHIDKIFLEMKRELNHVAR
jgi:hypothetical protein